VRLNGLATAASPPRLGHRGFAQRIARTVAARQDAAGLVVALHGARGEGKTSVFRIVKEDLAASPDVVVVDFNPWRFRDADHLVEMFSNPLAERLGVAAILRTSGEAGGEAVGEAGGDALRRYGRILSRHPARRRGSRRGRGGRRSAHRRAVARHDPQAR
jgi:hypothetical protein